MIRSLRTFLPQTELTFCQAEQVLLEYGDLLPLGLFSQISCLKKSDVLTYGISRFNESVDITLIILTFFRESHWK